MTLDLARFDRIMVNSSAGKDSQVALDVTVRAADDAGVSRDRIVVFHADLSKPDGSRNVEWDGTRELAQEHAEHYGLRFISIQREQGDILDHVLDRHRTLRARGDTTTPAWPSSTARWCTSDHKRGAGRRALTILAGEVGHKPARILNVMGFRRQESPARAKKVVLRYDEAASGKGTVRRVWEWCPILDWTADEVWARIGSIGTRHHPAYDAGMPRLSCRLCLAGETEVVTRSGIRPISDLAGGSHHLLVPKRTPYGLSGHGHFVECEVRSFGVQPLWQVTLRRQRQKKVIFATAEHRWLTTGKVLRPPKPNGRHNGYEKVTVERTTATLSPGEHIRALKAHPTSHGFGPVDMVPFAVAQGFVYGDGNTTGGKRPFTVCIHDYEKDKALLPFFGMHKITEERNSDAAGYTYPTHLLISGLPRLWKETPDFRESRSFLLSWLAGYYAADGCVTPDGSARLDSASLEALRVARSIAAVCGVGYGPVRTATRLGKGTKPSALHSFTLNARDLPDWFFLIDSHRARVAKRTSRDDPGERRWVVESVEPTDRVEEVFCAVVPGKEAFALTDDVMTGNCILAGKDALVLAAQLNPDLAQEYLAVEQEVGHTFRKDLSIADIIAAAHASPRPERIEDWVA